MTAGLGLILQSGLLPRSWFELGVLILAPYLFILYMLTQHRRQDALFRVVSENAADMIALVGVAGERLYNSPAYEKVLGYSAKELAATRGLDQIHPDDREKVIEAATQARLTGIG